MKPLVSVIIPVYNVENYVGATIASVCQQTYHNIEILCVDDGSTDNSLSILNFYSEKDHRLVVLSQKNSGVSAARNLGIKHANGEYLCFLDSDDFMHPEAIERQINTLEKSKADMSCCAFKNVNEMPELHKLPKLSKKIYELSDKPLSDFMFKRKVIDSSSCNKMYRTCLVKNNLFQLGVSRGEDETFVLNMLTKTKRVCALPQVLLYFRNRQGSLTKQDISVDYLYDHFVSFITLFEAMKQKDVLKRENLDEQDIKRYLAKKIYKRFVVHVLRKNKSKSQRHILIDVAIAHLQKLIQTGVLDVEVLPKMRRIMLKYYMLKKNLWLVARFCKI